MQLTDEQIYAKDAHDYLPVFARYQIVLDHGDGVYVYDYIEGPVGIIDVDTENDYFKKSFKFI